MEKYNYYEAVKEDIEEYIKNEIDFSDYDSMEELEEHLNDVLWTCDSVTGNGSGSYTFSTWEAEENICHNLNLLEEALNEFGSESGYLLDKGAEAADVTIRCYLLGSTISEVLEELEEEFNAANEEEEEE